MRVQIGTKAANELPQVNCYQETPVKNQFLALIAFPLILTAAVSGGATTIKCSNEVRGLKTQLNFSSTKPQLDVGGSMNGLPLQSYSFLNSFSACGQAMAAPGDCSSAEGVLAEQPEVYLFQFTCTDGRKGSLRFESGTVTALCFAASGVLANRYSGQNCQLSQK